MSPDSKFAARARAWLARLTGPGRRSPAGCDPQTRRRAIEYVVDGVDPRLRAVPGYARKLTAAVEHAVDYFTECGQWLAAPIEFSRRSWDRDPLVRALFATPEDLQRLFSDHRPLREFFHQHPASDTAYLGLGVTRTERRAFGVAMSGELVQRDVAQTLIGFCDYRLFGTCESEPLLRQNIEQRGFGFLIGEALERIVTQHPARTGHEHELQLLQLRLRGLMQKRRAVEAFYYESNAALDDEIADLRSRLMHAQGAPAPGSASVLEHYIDSINAVLAHAEDHVRRETVRLRINRMNVKVESPDEPADELLLSEVTIGSRPPRVVVLCRYPRAELLVTGARLDEAQQSLRR